jgi:hypothetical protein
MQALKELQDEGKIRFIALSEASVETIRRAVKIAPVSALQSEYSLWSTDTEEQIKLCEELGITFLAYSPLGRGFLSGEITKPEDLAEGDFRKAHPRFSKENFPKNIELVNKVGEIAARKGCTVGLARFKTPQNPRLTSHLTNSPPNSPLPGAWPARPVSSPFPEQPNPSVSKRMSAASTSRSPTPSARSWPVSSRALRDCVMPTCRL